MPRQRREKTDDQIAAEKRRRADARRLKRAQETSEQRAERLAQGAWQGDNTTEEVCYKYVGCFNRRNDTLTHPLAFPADPAQAKTKFQLYSRLNRLVAVRLEYRSDRKLGDEAQFRKPEPLIFLVHGYTESVSIANGKGPVKIAEHLRSQRHVHMKKRHAGTGNSPQQSSLEECITPVRSKREDANGIPYQFCRALCHAGIPLP
ncbi:hypothetical protein HPB49_000356 [Dermacentor silvarum]|uniref:Uncharacterized protein n=1 Tax=Dermacentor silvarum TaxID=543639 RepID=A0ACB8CCK7_DERSI|nr:hypothetical protein HPB49_000356 [Dermacentor silvarum]